MSADPTAEHIDAVARAITVTTRDGNGRRVVSKDLSLTVARLQIRTLLTSTDPAVHAALAASLPAEVTAASMPDAETRAALVDRGTLTEEWRVWFTGSDAPTAPVDEATSRRFTGDHRERRRVTPWEVAE